MPQLTSSHGPSFPIHLHLNDLLKHPYLSVAVTQVVFPAPFCVSVSPFSQKHSFNSSFTYKAISFSRMSYFSSLPREFQLFLYDPVQMSISLRSLCRFLQRAFLYSHNSLSCWPQSNWRDRNFKREILQSIISDFFSYSVLWPLEYTILSLHLSMIGP